MSCEYNQQAIKPNIFIFLHELIKYINNVNFCFKQLYYLMRI